MPEFIYSYALVSPGREPSTGVTYDSPYETALEFGQVYGRLLDEQGPPLPFPVTLHVWAGCDTSRDPDFVHVRRRVRNRRLEAVGS